MASRKQPDHRKKRRARIPKSSPFPVPIATLTRVSSKPNYWFYYTGELKEDHVIVTHSGDISFLHTMGFFGMGLLSRGAPDHLRCLPGFHVPTPDGSTEYLKVMRRRMYLRHKRWQLLSDQASIDASTDVPEELEEFDSDVEYLDIPEQELPDAPNPYPQVISGQDHSETDTTGEQTEVWMDSVNDTEEANLDDTSTLHEARVGKDTWKGTGEADWDATEADEEFWKVESTDTTSKDVTEKAWDNMEPETDFWGTEVKGEGTLDAETKQLSVETEDDTVEMSTERIENGSSQRSREVKIGTLDDETKSSSVDIEDDTVEMSTDLKDNKSLLRSNELKTRPFEKGLVLNPLLLRDADNGEKVQESAPIKKVKLNNRGDAVSNAVNGEIEQDSPPSKKVKLDGSGDASINSNETIIIEMSGTSGNVCDTDERSGHSNDDSQKVVNYSYNLAVIDRPRSEDVLEEIGNNCSDITGEESVKNIPIPVNIDDNASPETKSSNATLETQSNLDGIEVEYSNVDYKQDVKIEKDSDGRLEGMVGNSRVTGDNGVLETHQCTGDNGVLETHPCTGDNGMLETHPCTGDNGVLETHPCTGDNGVLETHPCTGDNGVLETHPCIGDIGVLETHPCTGDNGVLETKPCTGDYGVLENHPCCTEEADGQYLVVDDSDFDDTITQVRIKRKHTWKPVRKDDVYKYKEPLVLSLEEAFFLSYGLGCLSVRDQTSSPLSLRTMWCEFCNRKQRFLPSYVAYHYFRSKGWVPKCGILFGVDFILYRVGPPFYHSSYSVILKVVQEGDYREVERYASRKLTWTSLAGLNRITEQVGKTVLFCYVIMPKSLTEEELKSPSCLSKIKIRLQLLYRWVSSQERGKGPETEIP